MFSPKVRDAAGLETNSSPIFFTLHVPHHILGLPWTTEFPLKPQVLSTPDPHTWAVA